MVTTTLNEVGISAGLETGRIAPHPHESSLPGCLCIDDAGQPWHTYPCLRHNSHSVMIEQVLIPVYILTPCIPAPWCCNQSCWLVSTILGAVFPIIDIGNTDVKL